MAYKQKGWEAFSGAEDSPMKTYKNPRPVYSRKGELKKHGRGDVFHKDNVKLNVSEWGNLVKHGLKNNPVVNKNERKRQRNEVKKTLRSAFAKKDDGQDIVKSVKDQIKDLEQDIIKLKSRNNPGDQKRIEKLTEEIKRLKSK